MARKFARVWLRRLVRVSLWLVASLVAVLIIGYGVLFGTDWGRQELASWLEERAEQTLRGDVHIGELSGGPIGGFSVRDLRLTLPDGTTLAAIDELDVEVEILPLLGKEVRLDLDVRGLDAELRQRADGSLSTDRLLRERPEEPPSTWSVSIASLELEDGTVTLSTPDERLEVTQLSASASLEAEGERHLWTARDLSAKLRWSRPSGPLVGSLSVPHATGLTGAGSVALVGGRLSVRSSPEGPEAELYRLYAHRTAEGRFSVSARVQVPAGFSRELLGQPDLRAAAEIAIDVRGDDDRVAVEAAGELGGSDLLVRGELRDRDEADLFVSLRGVDPARSWEGAPRGDLDLKLSATGSVRAERGQLTADVRGKASGTELERASVALRYRNGTVRIAHSSLRARSSDLSELPLPVPVQGDAVVRASAEGTQDHLDVNATVTSHRLAWQSVIARNVRLTGQVSGIPSAIDWRARLAVGALVAKGERLGRLETRASGTLNRASARISLRGRDRILADIAARRRGEGYAIALQRARGRVRGVQIASAEGRLELGSGRAVVEGLQLRTSAGSISAQGGIDLPIREPHRGQIAAEVEDLDLAVASRLLGLPAVEGTATTRLAVELPRGPARVRTRVEGLRWAGQDERLTLTVAGYYENSNLDARVGVAGVTMGGLDVDFSRSAPDRLLSPEWTSLDPSEISRIHLGLRRVDLVALARLLRRDLPLRSGLARGEIRFDRDNGSELQFDVRAARLQLRGHSRFAAQVTGRVGEEDSQMSFWLRGARRSAASLAVESDVGLERAMRALHAWRTSDDGASDAVRMQELKATVTASVWPAQLAEVTGTRKDFGRWLTSATLRGRVSAGHDDDGWRLDSNARIALATSGIRQEVAVRGSLAPSSWSLRGSIDDGSLKARAWGTRSGIDGVRAQISRFDLDAPLGRVLEDLSGAQELAGEISGSLAVAAGESPRLALVARDVTTVHRAMPVVLRDGNARLELRDSKLDLRASASSRGGQIRLAGKAALDGYDLESGRAEVRIRKVPVTLSSGPIEVTTKARVRARSRNGLIRVEVDVEDSRVRRGNQPGASNLHPAEMPADIVFASKRKRRARDETGPTAVAIPDLVAHLFSREAVRVRGGDVNTRVEFDLTVLKPAGRDAIIRGLVEAHRGTITLRDRDWTIESAIVSLGGRRPPNPTFNIELSHKFDDAVVSIFVRGTLEDPEVEFSSNPPIYTQAQLLSLILTGSAGGSGEFAVEEGAVGAATALLGPELKRGIERTLPVDTVRFTGDGGSGLLLGRWITPNLFVAYVSNFRDQGDEDLESPHRAQLEYELSPQWTLEAGYGNRAEGNIDILWSFRF